MLLSEFKELINEAVEWFDDDPEIIIYDATGAEIEPSNVIKHLTGDNAQRLEIE